MADGLWAQQPHACPLLVACLLYSWSVLAWNFPNVKETPSGVVVMRVVTRHEDPCRLITMIAICCRLHTMGASSP
jgi:hypothetical protein